MTTRKRKSMSDPPQATDSVPGSGTAKIHGLPMKRARAASIKHATHDDQYVCEHAVPLRCFRFDFTALSPAGQQASLNRQGWNGDTREWLGLLCPYDNCRGFIMDYVAASAALAPTYQQRLCCHQLAVNRACASKWARHCGVGQTRTQKQRLRRCTHVHQVDITSTSVETPGNAQSESESEIEVELDESTSESDNEIESADQSNSEDYHTDAKKTDSSAAKHTGPQPSNKPPPIMTPGGVCTVPLEISAAPPRSVDQTAVDDPAATTVVSVSLPAEITLAQLATVPPELATPSEPGTIERLEKLMRPLLPPVFGELVPIEIKEGIAALQKDIVQRMAGNVKYHKQVQDKSGCLSYEVEAPYQMYHATDADVTRFVYAVAGASVWMDKKFNCNLVHYKGPDHYNNPSRFLALAFAMVQVLFPHFSRSERPVRHKADDDECHPRQWVAYRNRM